MNRKWADGARVALTLALAVAASAVGQDQATPKTNDTDPTGADATPATSQPDKGPAGSAIAVLERAAKANKYVFVFAYRTEDEPTQAARQAYDVAMEKLADRAMPLAVNLADPLERDFVTQYGLNRAPTPLVLAIGPNGAVTRSFLRQVDAAQLETAFVSPGMLKCLKPLQDRKLVFVCIQNGKTQHNAEALRGVKEFAAEAQYAKTTEVVLLDPADTAEESLLKQLKVDPKTEEAVTVFLAPPGVMVATYKGETQKDVLVAAAKTAAKGCDPKSGCCAPKNPAGVP